MTQDMWIKAVEDDPCTLKHIPDHLKTEDMCSRAVEESPWTLEYVPDQFMTH